MYFEVVSDRSVSIDALGTFEPNVPMKITDDQLKLFSALHGVELVNANFPPFITVTAVMIEGV